MNPIPVSLFPPRRVPTPFARQQSIIHGGDYNPEQWLPMTPSIIEDDAKLMQQTGINSATIGVFAWSVLEPSEGTFAFDWLDRVMDQQAAIGNLVILATPSGAMPAWLAEKYPDARRVDARDFRNHFVSRHNHCWTSPSFHERVRIINTKLAERYGKHPALAMWHVSNELYGQCFCNLCRNAWAQWLEQRYGSLAAMNKAHWAAFWSKWATAWNHVEPTAGESDSRLLDWLRFSNQQLINWYQFEADILRAITPNIPITTNFMTTAHGLNYQAIARVVDVVADDQYPSYDPEHPRFLQAALYWSMKQDLYRGMKPERTFMLMESCPGVVQSRTPMKVKRPGIHRLEMLQAIAHGADGTCYFQFRAGRGALEKLHGAVVEHWGTERHTQTRRFAYLRSLSDTYEKITAVLGTSVRPEVALIYDTESRWAQHLTPGLGIDNPPQDSNLRERHYFDQVASEQYEPFWCRGIPVDVIPNDRDLSRYKIVVLPMHWIMTPQLAGRLRDYVRGGGTLVATWDTAMADEHNRMLLGGWPGNGLSEVFGLWIEEMDRLAWGTPRAIGGLPGSGSEVAALMHLEGATAIATFAEDFYRGRAAVTRNTFGQGKAFYIGTRLDAAGREALFDQIISEAGCHVPFKVPLPTGVTAQWRGVDHTAFVFLLNFSMASQTVPLAEMKLVDMDTQQLYQNEIHLEPLAARVFRVSP